MERRRTHRTAGSRDFGKVLRRLTEIPVIEDSEDSYFPVYIDVEPEQDVVIAEVAVQITLPFIRLLMCYARALSDAAQTADMRTYL